MKPRHTHNWIALGLLLALFALLAMGARQNAFTVDEPAHIAIGYSILAQGAARGAWLIPQYGNPPLVDILEASVLYLTQPNLPVDQLDGWGTSLMPFIRAMNPYLLPLERTEVVTRMPAMLLTMLLGSLVLRWARELWGWSAGSIGAPIVALFILVLDPTLLAHGRLATTDVGTVTFGTAALYTAWRWTRQPDWRWTSATGVLAGLTMLSKASGALWAIAIGVMLIVNVIEKRRPGFMACMAHGLVVVLLSLLVIWAGYGFAWEMWHGLPVPAPVHWQGLFAQWGGGLTANERWVFALSERQQGNWWWYFPLAFLIKNPLPLLLGVGISLGLLVRRRITWSSTLTWGFFPVLYTALAITRGVNIGYRHMLPIHPFLYLAIGGGLGQWAWSHRGRWLRILSVLLGAWYIVGTLQAFPFELSYFNELIGARDGHDYLVDSNLDWGQGSKALRDYVAAHPGPRPQVAYHFSGVHPDLYGVELDALPPKPDAAPLAAPLHPPPGRYVIGADALERGWPADPDMYAWFRQIEPTTRLADSLFVYEVEPARLNWLSQCITPAVPLDDAALSGGFGTDALRRADFDCTSAWLYPNGGTSLGVYVLHHALVPEANRYTARLTLLKPAPRAADPFIARRLADARLAVNIQRYSRQSPAFVTYELSHPPKLPDPTAEWQLPVPLNGPLTFLGAAAYSSKSELDVETWWQVTQSTVARPFSIMGHLIAPTSGSQVQMVSDGLGLSPLLLNAGDVIVQRHHFVAPPAKQIVLRTGAYWLDTLERWPVVGMDADWIQLRLEVKP